MPAKKTPVKKRTAAKKPAKRYAKKRPAKKSAKRPASRGASAAVIALSLAALLWMGNGAAQAYADYATFRDMRAVVERAGFYSGVTVDGVDLTGYSLEQALSLFREREDALRDAARATLTAGELSFSIGPDDVNYRSNYASVIRHAYQVGRAGSLEERYDELMGMGSAEAGYSITRGYDADLLRARVEDVAETLAREPANARVKSFDAASASFAFAEAREGARVDADALFERVTASFASGGGETIAVRVETIAPTVTKADLQGRYGLIASAVTNASSSSSNRLTNIRTALNTISGTRVEAGATFSFNEVVGQRTKARGYKSAGAFVDGLVSEEVGGGICQVSTTLFNAVAKADLTIVERNAHSRPVAYVDKGKDAAVDWGGKDLRFTNTSGDAVYLVCYLSEDKRVHAAVYGRLLEGGVSIKIEAKTTGTLSPGADKVTRTSSLAPGERVVLEKARKGYTAVAYRVYYDKNGNETRREELCKSTYPASGAVIEVGR